MLNGSTTIERLKLVKHYVPVKVCELVVGDMFRHTSKEAAGYYYTHRNSQRVKYITVTEDAMVVSNYLHPNSPYAKLHLITSKSSNLYTGRQYSRSDVVYKLVGRIQSRRK